MARNDKGKALYGPVARDVRPTAEEADADTLKSFDHPGLSTVDDDGPSGSPLRSNEKGIMRGYNPYNSGALYKKQWKKKRDMRELSKWVELKKKFTKRTDG
jgi:hypothetical protein